MHFAGNSTQLQWHDSVHLSSVYTIQTRNDFCCFPSVTFEPLHYLLNFRVFYINNNNRHHHHNHNKSSKNHGLYGSTSRCISRQVNGDGQISTPTAPKPLNQFWWNSKLRTTIWRPPTTQDFISMRRRGWSRRIASLPLSGVCLCLSFFWSLRHVHRSYRWTDFDDLYVMWRISAQGCAFWRSRWYAFPFRGSNLPKPQFWGRE